MSSGVLAPLLVWVQSNADWVPLVVFLVAFVESVPIIGLFIPGSALLLGLGALVGAGALLPAPVLDAAIVGAVLGDAGGF